MKSGTRLGPYIVVSALGSGGMGEVYRARDTRLDRVVAIKTLPSGSSPMRGRSRASSARQRIAVSRSRTTWDIVLFRRAAPG